MVELIVKLLLFHASGDDFTILKYDVVRKVFQSQLLQGLVFQHFAVADDRACDRVALDVVLAFALAGIQTESHQRVNDKMLGFTYERRFESHADYPQLWAIRKAIRELRKNRKKGSENYHQKMDRLKSRAAEIELRINAELFGEARVIACTLVGSAHHLLEGMKFGTLFIDEAAQALEAACWIPMKRARRVILAGDHCQLPPTVKRISSVRAGLGKTLMERIAENKPEVVTLLKIQYRMNDEIMRFSSD